MVLVRWFCQHLLLRLTLLLLLAVPTARSAAAQEPAGAAGLVQTPVRGQLAADFVADGAYVTRGQLLAKLESPTGSPVYVSAPRAGRIQFVHPMPYGALAAHTRLASVRAPTPAAQLARGN